MTQQGSTMSQTAGATSLADLDPATRKKMMIRAIIASTVGTTIEWYDFFLYGIAAALVFPKLFFPGSNEFMGTLLAFSTYFVGFVARPLGGVIFGHIGDRLGRKTSLIATLLLMGVATAAVGIAPSYATAGMWGGIVLVLARVLQGVGVGGEWGGSILLAGEWTSPKYRGFAMSWPQFGGPAGLLLANAAVLMISARTTEEQFLSWGWRVPFLASVVLTFLGLWLRLRIMETPVFAEIKSSGKVEKAPIIEVVRQNWREVLLTAFMRSGQMVPFYIFITYILTYGTTVRGMTRATVLNFVMLAAFVALFSTPFFGWLSDKVGRRRLIIAGCVVMLFYPFVYFALIDTGVVALAALAIVLAYPIHDMQYTPQAAFIAETFAGSRRYSGTSLGYQLASLTAGGPAPIVALYLYDRYHTSTAIAIYMSLSAVVSLVALWMMRERREGALDKA